MKKKNYLVLYKDSWYIIIKNDDYFQIVHKDDFESHDAFDSVKENDMIYLPKKVLKLVWWRMKFSDLKKIIERSEK